MRPVVGKMSGMELKMAIEGTHILPIISKYLDITKAILYVLIGRLLHRNKQSGNVTFSINENIDVLPDISEFKTIGPHRIANQYT